MSKDHSHFIRNKKLGLKKIFHVLPPHDNDLSIKKVHFGIFTNLYSDGRKHESFFFETINKLDPQLVKFSIIGKGWKQIVKKLERNNFEINYQRFFFRKRYISELTKIDYLIYLGKDEGSMSFLDAIQLGIKTIMIPQGFQKDLKRFITYEVSEDLKNLDQIFEKILLKKKSYISTKQKLTWENYALEHIKIWEELKKR